MGRAMAQFTLCLSALPDSSFPDAVAFRCSLAPLASSFRQNHRSPQRTYITIERRQPAAFARHPG